MVSLVSFFVYNLLRAADAVGGSPPRAGLRRGLTE